MISKRIPNFFALGLGLERRTQRDDESYWPVLHPKVFFGCWIGNWTFRVGRKLKH